MFTLTINLINLAKSNSEVIDYVDEYVRSVAPNHCVNLGLSAFENMHLLMSDMHKDDMVTGTVITQTRLVLLEAVKQQHWLLTPNR